MSTNNNTDDYNEREGRVLELYDQGRSTREIAKELRMSLRDIGFILKKGQVNHGIITIMDNGNNSNKNNNNKPANEKDTQAYKLFSEGKTPVEVAIQLNLSEKEATRYYTEYWRLKRLYSLYHIYQESKRNLSYFLKLCRLAKRQGITADNIEWFVNMVDICTYKIPELQKQYAKLQDEVQIIDHQKVVSKAELDNMNNQVSILHRTIYQLSATCNNKRNEISYLQAQIQVLEEYVNGLKNRNQQQQEGIQNESYT
jgi:DNA-binding CsgD family transcriptional regulator/polyhydroxyalkanoate synthesis regulator phasin